MALAYAPPGWADSAPTSSPSAPSVASPRVLFSEAVSLCVDNAAVPAAALKAADDRGWEKPGAPATEGWRVKRMEGAWRPLRLRTTQMLRESRLGRLLVQTCSVVGPSSGAPHLEALASAYFGRTAAQRLGPVDGSIEGQTVHTGAGSVWIYQDDPQSGRRLLPPAPDLNAALAKGPVMELSVYDGEVADVNVISIRLAGEPAPAPNARPPR